MMMSKLIRDAWRYCPELIAYLRDLVRKHLLHSKQQPSQD